MSAQRKDCVLQFLFPNFKTLKFLFVQCVQERIKPKKIFPLEDDPSASWGAHQKRHSFFWSKIFPKIH